MLKKILITADDFGMCQAVDDAIISLIEVGSITTTNVLVNMETKEKAKLLRINYPNLSIGMHWNVTTGKPVSEIKKIKTLVDECGEFYSISQFKKRIDAGKISLRELEYEITTQYEIFKTYCGKADYWNTHENSALNFKAFLIYSKVAKKVGIEATRNFQRVYIDYDSISGRRRLKELAVRSIIDIWFGIIAKNKFYMPDGLIITFKPKSKLDIVRLVNALKSSSRASIEVVIHPSTVPNHPHFGNIAEERVLEYEFFRNEELMEAFKNANFKLCSYKDLN